MYISQALKVNNIVNRKFELYISKFECYMTIYSDDELVQAIKDEYELFNMTTRTTRKVYLVLIGGRVAEFSQGMTGANTRFFFANKASAVKKAATCNGNVVEFITGILTPIGEEDTQYNMLSEYKLSK
jgi:hypothetical protein